MKYKAHNYQTYCSNFIIQNPIAGLFLDCGLGKTVITLTAIEELLFNRFEVSRVLIIAPLRVARDTWPAEIEKWEHLKNLTYSVCIGTPNERLAALYKKADIYIINRENVPWLVESGLFHFDMVIIDELSSFKNHNSKRFKALRKMRPAVKRVVGLTGTPASNGLMDLFAEIQLLDMGERLGRYIGGYRSRYFTPDRRNQHIVFSYKPLDGAEEAIYDKISDICISMRSADLLQMPELTVNNVQVKLSEKEQTLYQTLKRDLILPFSDGDIDASSAASLSMKLHQMANGAVYDENQQIKFIHDRKIEALEDLVEAANGKPVLIAYWFKHDLQRILNNENLNAQPLVSAQDFKDWNEGKIPVALIHPASAGHGLNLQSGGSTLIWFGLTWSLELYQQTNARLYRQGQKHPVVIHHILTKGTVDEQVLKALNSKDKIQDSLLEAVKAEIMEVRKNEYT